MKMEKNNTRRDERKRKEGAADKIKTFAEEYNKIIKHFADILLAGLKAERREWLRKKEM